MKATTVMWIVLLLLVILMVQNPKRTTAEITNGERGLFGVGGAAIGGAFGNKTASRKRGG